MKKIIIDGKFLLQNITGIERYCIEIIKELDKICFGNPIEIVIPSNSKVITHLNLQNIKIEKYGLNLKFVWRQIILPFYIKKKKAIGVFLMNNAPFFCTGIVCMHDISMIVNPKFYSKKHVYFAKILYKNIFKYADKILTVSEFSKKEILNNFECKNKNIAVINNAWQHYENIPYDKKILEKYTLKESMYFFGLGGFSQNKNLQWMERVAEKNQKYKFIASGNINNDVFGSVKNYFKYLIFSGYLSDIEVKTLIKYSKAFVFPSFYEGFGLPPLEALSTGAKIIISDIEVMHEIYERTAYYIDPNNYDIDMDDLLSEEKQDGGNILKKFSWANSAKKLLQIIKEFSKC